MSGTASIGNWRSENIPQIVKAATNSPITKKIKEFVDESDSQGATFSSSWPMPETAIDVSEIRSRFPEISSYVEEKISECGEKLEDVMNSECLIL